MFHNAVFPNEGTDPGRFETSNMRNYKQHNLNSLSPQEEGDDSMF